MAYFKMTSRVFTGSTALEDAAPAMAELGSRVLIVTGPHVGRSPMMESLEKVLDGQKVAYAVFDGITGEPTEPMIAAGTEIFKKEKCDFVIGLGGGSPLDSAKAIAAMSVNPGKIPDYCGKEIGGSVPPIAAIPTTAGTGSETTRFTVISDPVTDVKMLLRGDRLVPTVAVLNPAFTLQMPKSVTASTGLDALTHAVEAYTSVKAMPFTDPYALSAVQLIMRNLPEAYKNGTSAEAREAMMTAAFEAGVCINNSSVTLVHGMSRPIGALFHVPHGMSNAMLLGVCLPFAKEGTPERFADLGRAIGAAGADTPDDEAGSLFLDKVNALVSCCEIPTLWEYGVDHDAFEKAIPKMASDAIASGSPGNTRRPMTAADCEALYRKLL